MRLNKYFLLEEFVPPQIMKIFGDNAIWYIDPQIIALATAYRVFFDTPVTINDWHTGGKLMYRGYRPPRVNIGAEYSMHKLGKAFDCNIGKMNEKQMFTNIKDNFEYFKLFGLTSIEDYRFTDGWLHSDIRPATTDKLLIVKPL